MLYDATPLPTYLLAIAKAGFSPQRLNAREVERWKSRDWAEVVGAFERSVGRGTFATLVPTLGLADVLVHHQDIRRPLKRPRAIPPERLVSVLDHPDPFASPRKRMYGLRFVATDVAWSSGDGPEVRGTGEAIVMAVAGRPAALAELSGEGVPGLRTRFD